MSIPSRPATTVLYVLAAFMFLVLIALVLLMAPLGIYKARRSWFFHENRNNPPCDVETDCIPFAVETCPAPRFLVYCASKHQRYKESVCICAENSDALDFVGGSSLWVGSVLEYERLHPDAGVDSCP